MGFLLHLLIINPKGSKKCPKTLMIVCPAGPGPGGGEFLFCWMKNSPIIYVSVFKESKKYLGLILMNDMTTEVDSRCEQFKIEVVVLETHVSS
jgi:hypothetical protein